MAKKKKRNDYVRFMDSLPMLVKLLFALPVLDGIFYGIYRITKGRVLIGLLWIFLGATILWLIDMICILVYNRVTVLA